MRSIPNRSSGPAQYLLRFDDLWPGMDWLKWERFLPMLERFDLMPILAVVPDNCDPALFAPPSEGVDEILDQENRGRRRGEDFFWEQMREFEKKGASIALHGYQHVCTSRGASLVPLCSSSEFAGVEKEVQLRWIRAGLSILRERGLDPLLWVAPRHGFDRATLDALWEEGIEILSDGFAVAPFRWCGFIWIPQQLWEPLPKKSGLWTICIHPATASDEQVQVLEEFLERWSGQFTSVDRVLDEWPVYERTFRDRVFQMLTLNRMKLSKAWRRAG